MKGESATASPSSSTMIEARLRFKRKLPRRKWELAYDEKSLGFMLWNHDGSAFFGVFPFGE
jgi:hypothetical protein